MKFKVYDEFNSSLEFAQEIEAYDEREAAELYAEEDVDGNIDGIYSSKDDRWTIRNLQEDGQPVCVVDEEGKVYHFKVGVTEYTPIYEAFLIEEKK